MIDENEIQKQWLERVHALGRAQNRHLWSTLVAFLFFYALILSGPEGKTVTVPIISLPLDAQVVLAAGPFVLALLIVATLGSMDAWRDAIKEYTDLDWRAAADRLDLNPNVLDLVLYTTRGVPLPPFRKLLGNAIVLCGYPGYFTLVCAEAYWLFRWLCFSSAPGSTVFIVVAAVFLPFAIGLVMRLWWRRIMQVFPGVDAWWQGMKDCSLGSIMRKFGSHSTDICW